MAMLPSTWCSPANPQGNCTPVSGVCKPMDAGTLAIYKDLQNQINRLASVKGKSLIGVDGRIGSGTVKALNAVMGTSYSSCDEVAALANALVGQVKAVANGSGAPTMVQSPAPPAPPSVVSASGAIDHPPDWKLKVAGFTGFLKSPLGLAVGLGTLIALYSINKSSPNKRK